MLMLPALAVLYVRHVAVRGSGAVLALISGTAAVLLGIAASASLDLRPAALLALGMMSWTHGKIWLETAVMPPVFGIVTLTFGVIAVAGAGVMVLSTELLQPGTLAAGQAWTIVQAVIGVWLLALAGALLLPRS